MIDIDRAKSYCKEDISLIKNYNKAISDNTQTWHCHHIDEINLHKKVSELIEEGQYYKVPASKLIFLTKSDHSRIHSLAENNCNYNKSQSEETKQKVRKTWKEKYKNGYVNPRTGKSPFEYFTEEEMKIWKTERSIRMKEYFANHPEVCEKISKKNKDKKRTAEQIEHYKSSFSEERRKQISENTRNYNLQHSEEISKRTIENNKKHSGKNSYVYGRKWMNNGIEEKLVKKEEIDIYLNKNYKLGRL